MKLQGNPHLKELVGISGKKKNKIEKINDKKIEIEGTEKLKGSPPVQEALKEYVRRKEEREKIKKMEGLPYKVTNKVAYMEDHKEKLKNVARIRVPNPHPEPPIRIGEKKLFCMRKLGFKIDWSLLKSVKIFSRFMGISQGEFIRRAISSFIVLLKSEGVVPKREKL